MDIADWLAARAGIAPDKTALRCGDEALSYRGLDDLCRKLAHALAAAGVARGDRVAWLGLNSIAMLAMVFACARRGAIFMPLNWRLAPPEHRGMLEEAEPKLLFAEAEFIAAPIAPQATRCIAIGAPIEGWGRWSDFLKAAVAADDEVCEPSAPLLLCFTSGSTGRPKGVLLARDALEANALAGVAMHAMVEDDRILTTLPMFHVGGLNIQTTPALRRGCTVTLAPRFDPGAAFDLVERDRITLTVLVPAQLEAMMAHPRWRSADLSSLRMISTGSTLVPERLIRAVHDRGIPLIQVWGATETAPIAACQQVQDAYSHLGTTGRAALGCELRVVDAEGREQPAGASGEILVRGRNVMSGYWRNEAATAAAFVAGWYRSGDSGHFDADGYLTIDGRLKDMIISGGENVSPAEVEAVLLDCPEVAEAAVVGRPDARWGEAVVAVVVPRSGESVDAARVLALFEGRLARFKHPKDLLVVDALPRSALGKVRKDAVRQLVAAAAADPPQEHKE